MIIKEYKHANILWKCQDFECEKTGIIAQKKTAVVKSIGNEFRLKENAESREYGISEEVFEIIKQLLV